MTATTKLACPECAAEVAIANDVLASEIVPCPECSAELEVTGTDPLAIQLAPEVQEDWGE